MNLPNISKIKKNLQKLLTTETKWLFSKKVFILDVW